ncbi:MAG: L,D-transpeptidase [Oscillatoria sp. SIO1A7]|nr:L,D-transpeptidase [Oscillatoria sp. SIO1A7]
MKKTISQTKHLCWHVALFSILLVASVFYPLPTLGQTGREVRETRIRELKQSGDRWVEIDVYNQMLTAWEGSEPIFAVLVSTGRKSARTPAGVFAIQSKHEVARMQGEGYDLPVVLYTMYYDGHYAIHGADWHNKFGQAVSAGCVNVPVREAFWLFEWASVGTPVVVRD